ncbi:MAG: hypothetical protein ABWJ42_02715 [Sulfolobales archaeon]
MNSIIPSRYTLIPEEEISQRELIHILANTSKTNITKTYVYPYQTSSSGLSLTPEIAYVLMLFIISLFLIFLVVLVSPAKMSIIERFVYPIRRSDHISREIDEKYRYDGVKLILRSIYLNLRRTFECHNCTPRELSIRYSSKSRDLERFAYLYEEIVYGDRKPDSSETEEIMRWKT